MATPELASAWFPVIRDYTLLICGVGVGIYGIIAQQAGVASVGWGMAGIGAAGRVATGVSNGK